MKTLLPKAILFDMDDTILTYSLNTGQSWQEVCELFADRLHDLPPVPIIQTIRAVSADYWSDAERHRVGRISLNKTRQKIIADALARLSISDASLAQEMSLAYATRRDAVIKPFPDAIETLDTLRKRDVRLALLTNGEAAIQRGRIEKHALASYFDCILIEGEFGVGKPDRRVYLHALQALGVAPEEAWMVGDNLEWEVALPQSLGIYAIWFDVVGNGLPESSPIHPDRIIRSLSELLDEERVAEAR